MNPITVFLTVACLAVGAGLGATGHLYSGAAVVIVAIVIASALKMANILQKLRRPSRGQAARGLHDQVLARAHEIPARPKPGSRGRYGDFDAGSTA